MTCHACAAGEMVVVFRSDKSRRFGKVMQVVTRPPPRAHPRTHTRTHGIARLARMGSSALPLRYRVDHGRVEPVESMELVVSVKNLFKMVSRSNRSNGSSAKLVNAVKPAILVKLVNTFNLVTMFKLIKLVKPVVRHFQAADKCAVSS